MGRSYLGNRPIASIEAKGVIDTAHRTRGVCGRVFRYAIATARAKRDIAADLRGTLAPRTTTRHAAITDPVKIGNLLRAIDGCNGQPATAAALKPALYVFARPTELRAAEWSEFMLNDEQLKWRIPAERMTMREGHIVPLSRQAVRILEEQLRRITGHQRCVFPAIGGGWRPLSENTLNGGLRRLGLLR